MSSKLALTFPKPQYHHVMVEFTLGGKQYSYRTADLTFKAGDLAVVQAHSVHEDNDVFQVVTVVGEPYIGRELSTINYKWIVCKVDVEAYQQRIKMEEEIRTELQELQRLAKARFELQSLESLLQGDDDAMARFKALLEKMGQK